MGGAIAIRPVGWVPQVVLGGPYRHPEGSP